MPEPTPPTRRRWFRFGLRTLLMLVAMAGVGLAIFVNDVRVRAEEQRAIKQLESITWGYIATLPDDGYLICGTGVGGTVQMRSLVPRWMKRLTGDLFERVEEISISSLDDGKSLHCLTTFRRLKKVALKNTPATEAIVATLKERNPEFVVEWYE